jgi:T5SS/PEP-CTERM-associated repeat protein/autotransporter-associated beta strand protein
LQVANGGTATLFLLQGGAVETPRGFIGVSSAGNGNVVVSGVDSQWNSSDQLQIGYFGSGTLEVTAGGLVTSNLGYVGAKFGGSGTANVDGAGSAWNSGSELSIGYEGTGTLRITGGGVVSSPIATVGNQSTGSGTAIVDGLGSIWTTTQSLTVGNMGVGTLAVSNGGLVVAGTVEGGGELALDGGTLRLISSDNIGNPVVLNAGGGAFDVPESTNVVALAGSLSGPGELVKTGTGVLQIAGSSVYAGNTRVAAGELQLNSSLLSDTASVYLAPAGILALAFSETDEIGSLFIDGVAQPKGTYGGTGSGADFEVPQITGAGLLRVTAVGLPGDYNVDGVVDAADYTTWRDQLGASAALANDPTLGVGLDDYYRWQMQFGAASADGGTSGQSAVPEPHLIIQFLMLAFCLPLARIGGRSGRS